MSLRNGLWIKAVSAALFILLVRGAAVACAGDPAVWRADLDADSDAVVLQRWNADTVRSEREESSFRRAEIVFFISLPASVLFSLLGLLAFRGAAGVSGSFSAVDYQYIALSSIGISLSIALSDRSDASRGYR